MICPASIVAATQHTHATKDRLTWGGTKQLFFDEEGLWVGRSRNPQIPEVGDALPRRLARSTLLRLASLLTQLRVPGVLVGPIDHSLWSSKLANF